MPSEVTEYVIIAPKEHRAKLDAEMVFVLPVMNRPAEGGKWDATPMNSTPDPQTVAEITRRLSEFRLSPDRAN